MELLDRILLALRISRSKIIVRRYFITNGFDGVLAILGLLVGFRVTGSVEINVLLTTGFGTAIALAVSGLSSAYISESAERKHELDKLRSAMMDDLDGSTHEEAATIVPVIVAMVNGLAPFLFAQLILLPLWLASSGAVALPSPVDVSIGIALALVFLLGIFIGRLSGTFWLWAGIRATLLAIAIVLLIMLFS